MDAKSVCLKTWLLIFATGVLEILSIHSKQKAKLNIPRAQSIGQSFRLSFRARVSRQALHLAVIYSNDSPTLVSLHKLPAFPPGLNSLATCNVSSNREKCIIVGHIRPFLPCLSISVRWIKTITMIRRTLLEYYC